MGYNSRHDKFLKDLLDYGTETFSFKIFDENMKSNYNNVNEIYSKQDTASRWQRYFIHLGAIEYGCYEADKDLEENSSQNKDLIEKYQEVKKLLLKAHKKSINEIMKQLEFEKIEKGKEKYKLHWESKHELSQKQDDANLMICVGNFRFGLLSLITSFKN